MNSRTDAESLPITQLSSTEWVGFFGMVFGMFMAVLDIQIVSSSIKEIQAGLSATSDEIAWVQTAYLIAEVIVIPISGWLCRACSTRYVFTTACFGFTVLSLCCAFSWDINSMLGFRFFQGLFGGVMIPTVFATIFTRFPKQLQSSLTVVVGLVVTIAPTLGPTLGGYLTEITSWHYLFLVNILPGFLVCISSWLYTRFDEPDIALFHRIDFLGILYIALFLGPLQFVLEEGAKKNWFDSNFILCLSGLSATSFFLMLHRELNYAHPVIDIRALKDPNFAFGCLFSFVIGWGMFSVVFLMPMYLGAILGLNSYQIGTYVMVTGCFQFFSAPLAGALSKKMDNRLMLAFGLFTYGFGTYLNGKLTHDSAYWEFFFPQALRGLSLMFCFLPTNTIALGRLPVEKVKNASGLYNLMRNLGGAIGLAITNTHLLNATKSHYALLHNHVSGTSLETQLFLGGLSHHLFQHNVPDVRLGSLKLLQQIAEREGMILTFNEVFQGISFIFFAAILLIPLLQNASASDKVQ